MKGEDSTLTSGLPETLFKTWVHAHEEDESESGSGSEAKIEVYRPRGYPFPPARGRAGFAINEDGTFVDYGIAPADGSQMTLGRWERIEHPEAGSGSLSPIALRVLMGNTPTDPRTGPRTHSFLLEIITMDDQVLRVKMHRN